MDKKLESKEKPQVEYLSNNFTLKLYNDWEDKTIFTLTGPVTDGIQHNIIVTREKDIQSDSVVDYAEWQIRGLEEELKSCLLLKKGKRTLQNGMPAYEAIFKWYPTDELRIYQHQIYVLHNSIGYKLTASFTKKTRKIFGPQVERMMLSFNPTSPK